VTLQEGVVDELVCSNLVRRLSLNHLPNNQCDYSLTVTIRLLLKIWGPGPSAKRPRLVV